MTMGTQRWFWSLIVTVSLVFTASAQSTHTEQDDAGDLPETAQATGTDALDAIEGTLGSSDVDMYAI